MTEVKTRRIFITGIGTGVGKTICSAILCEALYADYWKPIQAGDLDNSDTMKVQSLVSNNKSKFHVEAHKLTFPMSPHASAKMAGININTDELIVPKTDNSCLIIEGAGGLMVPINDETLYIDLIPQFNAEVILISRNYLGSINHTLLSVEALIKRNIHVLGIIFNGEENAETESIILKKSELPLLGRVAEIENISKKTIQEIAELFNKI